MAWWNMQLCADEVPHTGVHHSFFDERLPFRYCMPFALQVSVPFTKKIRIRVIARAWHVTPDTHVVCWRNQPVPSTFIYVTQGVSSGLSLIWIQFLWFQLPGLLSLRYPGTLFCVRSLYLSSFCSWTGYNEAETVFYSNDASTTSFVHTPTHVSACKQD